MRRFPLGLLVFGLVCSSTALAQEEMITDVRVLNAVRTDEETVRSIAGISIGDALRPDTLDVARERLHSAGLFADVNVYWEPYRDGVRVVIAIREKFPWAPVPTFSYSPGNISAGGVLAHGNLFGRGKRGLLGGRISNVDSGFLVVYDDPAFWGSWGFFTVKGKFQSQIIPEYSNVYDLDLPLAPLRKTRLRSYGFDVKVGIAWFRKVRTSFGWNIDQNEVRWSSANEDNPFAVAAFANGTPLAATNARRGNITGNLTFDFRARQHAVMFGNALGFNLEYAAPRWGSELWYWKASAEYEHGIRLWKRHNLILRAGAITGENLPFWSENSAGGTNLRGYLYRQFQGDTHLRTQVEYHFPLFSIWSLDVRGLIFNDAAAIWFRKLPEPTLDGSAYVTRGDGRQFLPPAYLRQGFLRHEDIHTSAGAGLRFYLRSVAVPLVGVDVGNGIGTRDVRVVLVVGA
ncbi:MAG: BamA/TamA family outer membrane protein [Deltaproteobacteria bacterium]|nr:BamA/TamA family outer membrane protein [Deltaproteobacteria bacterium]